MSLLPEGASFEERVHDCFLAYRGAGVMLSPLDAELVEGWAAMEIPFEVVARGIRRAAETALWDARPGEGGPRSLRAVRREIEREIKKYLGRSAGRGSTGNGAQKPPHLVRHGKLLAALRKSAREREQLGAGVKALLSGKLALPPSSLEEAASIEEAVLIALVRALPFSERLPLLCEARRLSDQGAAVSARARKLARRLHRAAVLRRRLVLPTFW